ncbi:MAG: methionine--tRNA ligase [Pseudomonadota bacterium]|nr:methionine--tRNA ligase [Pseudomonadota bacterium]
MKFYLTTPLYYVNDTPHIGHAYATIIADVLIRYHKLFGHDTLFLTGTDEHGQKVFEAAKKRGIDPQVHCDEMSKNYKRIWEELEISYDIFFRTSDAFHKKAVQDSLQELFDKGEIYSQDYEGWYCVSDEIYYQEKDLVNGKSPTGREVVKLKEKNYFFKMSKYHLELIDHIEKNPKFIQPDSKKNEVMGFLRQPLNDLCISRPKSRLTWGVEIPFDKDYVTYVWFDALLNYATGVGFKQKGKEEFFKKWWCDAGAIHFLGKDILTTHAVYWSTMLLALKIPLPKMIFAHGWWLTESNEKISKSAGPVVRPLDVKAIVGVEPLRYYLTRDVNLGNDAQFSQELVVSRINSELANNLGNLLSRSTNLVAKYFDGKIPASDFSHSETKKLKTTALLVADKLKDEILNMAPQRAIGHVIDMLNDANKYLEEMAPWKAAKTDLQSAGESLATSLECLRIAGILLSPVMPLKMQSLLESVGWSEPITLDGAKGWPRLTPGTAVGKAEALFPRIQ